MKKIRKNVLPALILAASMPAFSAPDVTVTSVTDLVSVGQTTSKLIKWINDDNIAFFSKATYGGTALDVSLQNLSFNEMVSQAITDGLIDSDVFSNYPNLPTDEAALAKLRDDIMQVSTDPTQEEFVKFTEKTISIAIFSPLLSHDEKSQFIGESDDKIFLAESDLTTPNYDDIYSCDIDSYDRTILPSAQTVSCSEIISDLDLDGISIGLSYSVNSTGSIVLRSADKFKAIVNGTSYTINKTISGSNGISVIPGTKPIIISGYGTSTGYGNSPEIFYLHTDGFSEQLTLVGFSDVYNAVLNDRYLAVTSNLIQNTVNENVMISVCQYTINSAYTGNQIEQSGNLGGTLACDDSTKKNLDLPVAFADQNQENIVGYLPTFAIGYEDELAMAFSPGNDLPLTTALYDIATDEITFISNQKQEALAETYGSNFIDAIESTVIASAPDYPFPPSDPASAGFMSDINQEEYLAAISEIITWTATQPGAYAEYLETGLAPVNGLAVDTDSVGQIFHLILDPIYFHDENTLMTPNAKYTLTRPANTGTLRARIALPNNEAPVGAIATVQASDGTLTTKTTDANGVFAFANLPVGNYTVQISYSKHVASCLTAEITADNTNNMGVIVMLAGDLDENGTIANQDVWRFNARANFPTEDFDVNNDGLVNIDDKNMIISNIGATQCQL